MRWQYVDGHLCEMSSIIYGPGAAAKLCHHLVCSQFAKCSMIHLEEVSWNGTLIFDSGKLNTASPLGGVPSRQIPKKNKPKKQKTNCKEISLKFNDKRARHT